METLIVEAIESDGYGFNEDTIFKNGVKTVKKIRSWRENTQFLRAGKLRWSKKRENGERSYIYSLIAETLRFFPLLRTKSSPPLVDTCLLVHRWVGKECFIVWPTFSLENHSHYENILVHVSKDILIKWLWWWWHQLTTLNSVGSFKNVTCLSNCWNCLFWGAIC